MVAVLLLNHSDYDKGLDDSEKKASSFGSKLKAGLGSAAKAAASAVAAVGTAATAATTALVKNTGEVAAYGDNIDKASQKLGISAEAYQEWDAVLQHSGANISSLQMGLKTLSNKFQSTSEVIAKSDTALDALDEQFNSGKITLKEYNEQYDALYAAAYEDMGAFTQLGLSMMDLESTGGDTEKIFSLVVSKLQEMPESAERTALASDLLGRSAMELGALLNTSAEDTQKMRDRVHELGGVMSDEAVKAAAAYQDSLQDMNTAIDGVKRNMVSEFLPAVTSVMDGLTGIFSGDDTEGLKKISEGVNSFVDKLNDVLPRALEIGSNIILSLTTAIAENLPDLMSSVVDIISSLVDGIIENSDQIISAIVDTFTTVIKKLPELLPKLLKAGLEIVKGIAEGIADNIGEITQSIVEVTTNILTELTNPEVLTGLLEAGLEILMGLATGLINAIPTLLEALPQIITSIITTLVTFQPQIITAGIQLFTALVGALPEIIGLIVAIVPKIITSLIEEFSKPETQEKLIDSGVELFEALVSAVPEILAAVGTIVPKIVESLFDAFTSSDSMSDIREAGKNMMDGLWKGIQSMTDTVKQNVQNFFGGLVDGIKNTLGIHSPSTVFAGMGKNMALGVGVGFDDEMSKVAKEMENAIPTEFDTASKISVGQVEYSNSAVGRQAAAAAASYASSANGSQSGAVPQPLIVIFQLPTGVEVGRQYIEDINAARRADGNGGRSR